MKSTFALAALIFVAAPAAEATVTCTAKVIDRTTDKEAEKTFRISPTPGALPGEAGAYKTRLGRYFVSATISREFRDFRGNQALDVDFALYTYEGKEQAYANVALVDGSVGEVNLTMSTPGRRAAAFLRCKQD